MDFGYFPVERFTIARSNMRYGKKAPDISDILPSVRRRGVFVPVIARGCADSGPLEIEAGRRRYYAALALVSEGRENVTLPCVIAAPGDDADALEVSMIENLLRQDPDQVTQWESFVRLVKKGRDIDDIAATFALSELQVKRILALGNLLPRIREAFRAEDIDAATAKHLTLATKAQQKAWLALFDDPQARAPRGSQLKAWLFGGASIAVSAALFDLATYDGQIVTNLFEEAGYFADAEQFWAAQEAEIEMRKAGYLAQGWRDVMIVPPGTHFTTWEHEHVTKRKDGRVYIDVHANGEVAFHEGYLTRKEARRGYGESGTDSEPPPTPKRAELTAALTNYIDLHRHAAVRTELAAHSSVALRVMVAHAICGSPLWGVKTADQRSRVEAITTSIETSPAQAAFTERRRAVQAVLGLDVESASVVQDRYGSDLVPVVLRLHELSDSEVMEVLALVMAETLAVGSDLIEVLGPVLKVDMANYWQADQAFYDLLRDREVLTAILAEVGGEAVASANAHEKGKVIKGMIADCLTGSNGRPKAERWVPKWMAFPPAAYTERGGVATVAAATRDRFLDDNVKTRENLRWCFAEYDLQPEHGGGARLLPD